MKTIALCVLILGLMAGAVPEAKAATCAKGVYRAGCVGPNGAVVHRRPATTVVAPARHCYYRAGVRICR